MLYDNYSKISDPHSSVAEDSGLLGCAAVSWGKFTDVSKNRGESILIFKQSHTPYCAA